MLIPQSPIESTPLIAVGYTEHGGRSWVPSTLLASLNATEDQLNLGVPPKTISPPIISRQAPTHATFVAHTPTFEWAYQGSPRSKHWYLSGGPASHSMLTLNTSSNMIDTQPYAALLRLRNLSATAHPFEIEDSHHWQWSNRGWSRPRSVSWIPVQGEVLIAIPRLNEGQYRAGALGRSQLTATLSVIP